MIAALRRAAAHTGRLIEAAVNARTLARTVRILARQLDNAHLLAASEEARADRAELRVAELEAQQRDWAELSGELAAEQPAADALPDLTDAGEAPIPIEPPDAYHERDRADRLQAMLQACEVDLAKERSAHAKAWELCCEARAERDTNARAAGAHIATIEALRTEHAHANDVANRLYKAARAVATTWLDEDPTVLTRAEMTALCAAIDPVAEASAQVEAARRDELETEVERLREQLTATIEEAKRESVSLRARPPIAVHEAALAEIADLRAQVAATPCAPTCSCGHAKDKHSAFGCIMPLCLCPRGAPSVEERTEEVRRAAEIASPGERIAAAHAIAEQIPGVAAAGLPRVECTVCPYVATGCETTVDPCPACGSKLAEIESCDACGKPVRDAYRTGEAEAVLLCWDCTRKAEREEAAVMRRSAEIDAAADDPPPTRPSERTATRTT